MEHGWIRISQPSTYSKHECILIGEGQKKLLCVLKGRLQNRQSKEIICEGDACELRFMNGEKEFEVLEDSTVITIDCDEMNQQQPILDKILTSTVEYITGLREKLLKENPSIRP